MIGTNRRRGLMGGAGARDFVLVEATQNGMTARILQDSYDTGWIASPDRLMMSEAPNILTINTNGLTASSFSASANDFSWWQYLENAEIVDTYSYHFRYAFIVVPPDAVNRTMNIRRFQNSKIVLLQRTPFPVFYANGGSGYNYGDNHFRNYEDQGSTFYVPDESYNDWLPYVEAAANCPSWMSNTGITCARISDLTAEEQAKIKIPY